MERSAVAEVLVRITVLGAQSITDPGGAARTRSARTLALVTYLVLHAGTPQPRQRIAELFWPESTDAQALTNLRRELHALRHVLGTEPCLVVTGRDLCWQDTPGVRVDAREFALEHARALAADRPRTVVQHAEAALAEYRGDLLPGNAEDWLLAARDELQEQAVELCALICATYIAAGEPARALDAARRRIRLQPLEETGYRVLIGLLADLGDRAGAVSTYHRCASVLERELGVTPGEATRAALRRVLAQPHRPRAAGVGAPGDTVRDGPAGTGLVGRDAQFAAVGDAWRRAAAGGPRVLVVSGVAGVGKTRLLTELTGVAGRGGAVVAASRCFDASGRLALAPVAEWLRSPDVQPATAGLGPLWRVEVERLVSVTGGAGAEPLPAERPVGDGWHRHRFFDGLARGLLATHRPTLLILDDLQWCDPETLAFVGFLAGLSTDTPVLVAGSVRSDFPDPAGELTEWMSRLRTAGMLTEVAVQPLELDDTARLAEALAGRPFPARERELLQTATAGFPLHIVEAVRAVAGRGDAPLPAGDLAGVLRSRLDQSGSAAREIAELAAAVRRDFTLDLLVEAGELDADTVVQAIDELWCQRILTEHGERYDFSHEALRDAAYERVSPARRWLLHRRLAHALELMHAADTGPVAAQLAEQYALGGRPDRALPHYRRAAAMASGVFAHAEAIRLLSEALAIARAMPTGHEADALQLDLLEDIAAPINERRGYSSPELEAVMRQSLALAESLGRTSSTVNALVGLCTSLFVQGRMREAHEAATRALALTRAGSDLADVAHFAYGCSAFGLGMPAESVRHCELAAGGRKGVSLTVGSRPEVHGQALAAHGHWLLGHDDEARSAAAGALATARRIRNPYNLAIGLAYAAMTHQLLDERAELAPTVAELRSLCERHGFSYYNEWGLVLDGWCRGGPGGIELARRGIGHLRADGSFARMPYWLALLADLLAGSGERAAARSTLDAAIADARARSDVWWLPEVQRLRAAHDTDPAKAAARLLQGATTAAGHGSTALERRCRNDLAALRSGPEQSAVRPTG